ncbi:hypothetical protein [Desulfobacter curvatus]|uniref:hypothetical protein n=1 Tax=Desulfobacter curvatus TaxID=2290 RepID=UPI000367E155|nr:hypothetical protein [Desulfobacter curvatus]
MIIPSKRKAIQRNLTVLKITDVALFCVLFWLVPIFLGYAQEETSLPEMEWDGHLKLYSRILFPKSNSAYQAVGLSPNYDGYGELRLNNKTFFGDTLYMEVNYEALAGGGGTREDGEKLKARYPALFPNGLSGPIRDDHRFFDLTATLHQGQRSVIYHRLDRAFFSFSPSWGEIRIGRQAVTWGHGFTFNPMDLFNPFAPTDLERDYKTGDDLILVHFPVKGVDVDMIYAAHRDPETDKAGMDQSSLGVKLHANLNRVDTDIMVARHYKDMVTGIGTAGTLGDAAFRLDLTGTFLDQKSRGRSFYISGVANIDYSWVWFNRNWYGYIELYYNGLSDNDYTQELMDPAVSDRLDRGELFALGRWYASANVNLEIHPLVNLYITPIINLHDDSGMLLPRIVYDFSDNIRITLTALLNWGATGTEYGGYVIPDTGFTLAPADTISAWITWYF